MNIVRVERATIEAHRRSVALSFRTKNSDTSCIDIRPQL